MLLTASMRAAPPMASAARARHAFGPAASQAASVEGALVPLACSVPCAAITAAVMSAAPNKAFAFRKIITRPVLLILCDFRSAGHRAVEERLDEESAHSKAGSIVNRTFPEFGLHCLLPTQGVPFSANSAGFLRALDGRENAPPHQTPGPAAEFAANFFQSDFTALPAQIC